MKTLFAVDSSGSINGLKIYFKQLRILRDKYYNSERGDKFYTWDNKITYMSKDEMNKFIDEEKGDGGTESTLIAKMAIENKSEKFEHLIIVTDGMVDKWQIDECDKLVNENGIKFSYVSIYIIGYGANESVGCPFCRGCVGKTYKVDENGNVIKIASVSSNDIKALENINNINNLQEFNNKFENLFNAIRAECLGKEKNENLINKLKDLQNRISIPESERNDFSSKFSKLYGMANGSTRSPICILAY